MNRRHESHEVLRTFCLKKISLGINKSRPKKATIIFSKRYGKHPFLVPKETVQNSGLWLGSRSWWESAKNHWEGSHFSSKVFFFVFDQKSGNKIFGLSQCSGTNVFFQNESMWDESTSTTPSRAEFFSNKHGRKKTWKIATLTNHGIGARFGIVFCLMF